MIYCAGAFFFFRTTRASSPYCGLSLDVPSINDEQAPLGPGRRCASFSFFSPSVANGLELHRAPSSLEEDDPFSAGEVVSSPGATAASLSPPPFRSCRPAVAELSFPVVGAG